MFKQRTDLRYQRGAGGFTMMEAAASLALIALIISVLAGVVMMQTKSGAVLAQKRAVLNHAEAALVNLQLGRTPPSTPEGMTVDIQVIEDAAAPAEQQWVRVHVQFDRLDEQLVGLAPKSHEVEGRP